MSHREIAQIHRTIRAEYFAALAAGEKKWGLQKRIARLYNYDANYVGRIVRGK
jgi:hypothetical protein